jgi:hypothetical protein
LGTAKIISEKLMNNDSDFFLYFSKNREKIENVLIENKELIATILQKLGSVKRVNSYSKLINSIYLAAKQGKEITDNDIIDWVGLTGKIFVGNEKSTSSNVSDETKNKVFIHTALKSAPKCPLCGGYIDTNKSISYDHIIRKQDGGLGDSDNIQITHPYCNQSIKN